MTAGTWLAVALLAVTSGTLVRLSLVLGIPALRMLGFWCLVAIGLLVARAAARSQEEMARREVIAALARLGGEAGIVPVEARLFAETGSGTPAGRGAVTVVGPAAVGVLVLDGVAEYSRGPLVRRRLERAAARGRAVAGEIGRRAAAAGVAVPVRAAVVLLRRRPRAAERAASPLPLLNPEEVAAWAAGALGGDPPLASAERERLLAALGTAMPAESPGTDARADARPGTRD